MRTVSLDSASNRPLSDTRIILVRQIDVEMRVRDGRSALVVPRYQCASVSAGKSQKGVGHFLNVSEV